MLVNENQVIIAETLNIKGMVKNRKLAKAINDTGWYQLLQFIFYKLEWVGSHMESKESIKNDCSIKDFNKCFKRFLEYMIFQINIAYIIY